MLIWWRHFFLGDWFAVVQGVGNRDAFVGDDGVYLRVFRHVHGHESQGCRVFGEHHTQGMLLGEMVASEIYACQIVRIIDDSCESNCASWDARCQGGDEITQLGVVVEYAIWVDVLVLGFAAWTRGRLEGNHAISGIGDGGIHLLVYAAVQLVVFLDVVAHLQLSILLEKGIDIAAMGYYHLVICCLGTQQVTAKRQRKDDKSNSRRFRKDH